MKNSFLIALTILLCNISLISQCPENPTFTSQAQINLFPDQYPGCKSFRTLTITGNDINDLRPLSGIQRVTEYIIISKNPILPNLKGLDSLVFAYSFSIDTNLSLSSLEGLGSLDSVFNSLYIISNPRLKDLKGLENLSELRFLNIYDNDSLQSVDGLDDIIKGVSVNFIQNPRLVSLHGLQNFESGDLRIDNNDALINLNGLDRLSSVLFLDIARNDNLEDILGLKRLEEIEVALSIHSNPKLSHCEIYYFCNSLFDPDQVQTFIHSNSPSCISLDSILASCNLANSYAIGTVYIDLNCNQILDDGDVPLGQQIIESVESEYPLAATTQAGQYVRYLFDDDTMSLRPRELFGFTSTPPFYEIITDTTFLVFDSIDFALCPDTIFYELEVSLTNYIRPRPGFSNNYQICIQNRGTNTMSANLTFDFSNAAGSEYITIINADASGFINGTTVTWSIPDIPIFAKHCMDVEIMLDASTPLGTILLPHVIATPIEPVTEIDLSNNEITLSQTVVGSVDPNEKTVDADRINWGYDFAPLEYIIRFQNTGTFPATFIEIADTLVNELDIRSFEMIAASHPYTISFPDTNIVNWRFDNINLPDSTSNEPESHGFVHFKINTRSNLDYNTIISNKAAIYFDFNDPVITNSTSTIVDVQIKTKDPVTLIEKVLLYPNPNSGFFQLQFELKEKSTGRIEIFNSQGNALFAENLGFLSEGTHSIPLEITSAPEGIYFLRLLTNKGLVTTKVFIAK